MYSSIDIPSSKFSFSFSVFSGNLENENCLDFQDSILLVFVNRVCRFAKIGLFLVGKFDFGVF